MTERLWRTVVATIGIASALIVFTTVEQRRSVHPPSDWHLHTGKLAPIDWGMPRILESRWRLGPDAEWRTDVSAKQWFFRPWVPPGAVLTMEMAEQDNGIVLGLQQGQSPSVNLRSGEAGPCEGDLPAVQAEEYPLILTRTDGGLLLTSKPQKMACLGALVAPSLRAEGGVVEFASIGSDGRPVGQPLSPLEWLAGMVFVGFCMMVVLELERSRGMRWPVIVATGGPAWLGALLLFVMPELTLPLMGGVHISMFILVGVVLAKSLALIGTRPLESGAEE